jgi:hypothetical protein
MSFALFFRKGGFKKHKRVIQRSPLISKPVNQRLVLCGLLANQAKLNGSTDGFGAVRRFEFLKDMSDVGLDGIFGNI